MSCLVTILVWPANSLGIGVGRLVQLTHMSSRAVRRINALCLSTVWLLMAGFCGTACGSDEVMVRQWEARPGVDGGPEPAPRVNPCGALRAMFEVPGVLEGLCALRQQDRASTAAMTQCRLCAAGTTALEGLWPQSECRVTLNDCPVADADLHACFATMGGILSEQMPRCAVTNDAPDIDATTLALTIATSSCAEVLIDCPPLQKLVLDLVTSTPR